MVAPDTARPLGPRIRRRLEKVVGAPGRIAAYRRFLASVDGPQDRKVFERLRAVPGFDNGSAHATLMCEAYHRVLAAGGDVLECGPGLSSLALEAAARQTGARVYSLEHSELWARRTRRLLWAAGARRVDLRKVALRSYGDFEWYAVPDGLPERFSVVLCDGPPGVIAGGRFGLLPVMGERIAGATILVDDAARPKEAEALRRWDVEFGRPSRVVQVGEEPAMGIMEPVGP